MHRKLIVSLLFGLLYFHCSFMVTCKQMLDVPNDYGLFVMQTSTTRWNVLLKKEENKDSIEVWTQLTHITQWIKEWSYLMSFTKNHFKRYTPCRGNNSVSLIKHKLKPFSFVYILHVFICLCFHLGLWPSGFWIK